jgi:hypothetical protein
VADNALFKYVLAWVPMVFIGVGNGILRETTYGQYMDELLAHQISAVTAIAFFGLYVWFLVRRWPIPTSGQALTIGLLWLVLTVVFEFIFGHYIMGHPWARLLHDYNILEGRVWSLVLLWITVAPYVLRQLAR